MDSSATPPPSPDADAPRPRPDTGEVCYDLPSPYQPHASGLLHLPRFLAKIRKHLAGELPRSYQRNFTRGFDGFLCLHLGLEPKAVIALVRDATDEADLQARLAAAMPPPGALKVHEWNRKLVQMGMRGSAREKLEETKAEMGIADRTDLISFADMIEFDEGRIR